MKDVLRVIKTTQQLKPGAWVRLKRGVYKDDLAQVDYVEAAQNQVSVKLIPRIDYNKLRGFRSSENKARGLKFLFLRARFFLLSQHTSI